MAVREKRYTTDDFWAIATLPENADKRLELIDGEIYEMPASFIPSKIAVRFSRFIDIFVDENDLGHVTDPDGSYIISEHDTFIPDVGFVSRERLPEMPERECPVPPDLAVEVVSPTDSVKAVQRKALRYLEAGTRMVWIAYPKEQSVDVCLPAEGGGMIVHEKTIDDVLDGGDVLPGFKLAVREIFPES